MVSENIANAIICNVSALVSSLAIDTGQTGEVLMVKSAVAVHFDKVKIHYTPFVEKRRE